MFIRLKEFDVSRTLRGTPGEDESDVVDEARFAEFFERVFVVLDIDHYQDDAEGVFSLQPFDAGVDVFGVEAVVFQAQEEGAGCHAEDVVGGNVAVFPWH